MPSATQRHATSTPRILHTPLLLCGSGDVWNVFKIHYNPLRRNGGKPGKSIWLNERGTLHLSQTGHLGPGLHSPVSSPPATSSEVSPGPSRRPKGPGLLSGSLLRPSARAPVLLLTSDTALPQAWIWPPSWSLKDSPQCWHLPALWVLPLSRPSTQVFFLLIHLASRPAQVQPGCLRLQDTLPASGNGWRPSLCFHSPKSLFHLQTPVPLVPGSLNLGSPGILSAWGGGRGGRQTTGRGAG